MEEKISEATEASIDVTNPGERIIPITILTSRHTTTNNNENNEIFQKKLEEDTKRHSLVVTLDDGTTTETQGVVTKLANDQGDQKGSENDRNDRKEKNGLSIQEIGQDTFKRELMKSQKPLVEEKVLTINSQF